MRRLHRVQEWRVRWGAVNDHVLESVLHLGVDVGVDIIIDEVNSSPHQLTCLGANLGEELLETLKRCHCHPNRMMHQTDFIRNRRGDVAVPASLIVDHPSGRLSSRCSTVASLSPNVQAALIDDDAVPPARRLRGTTGHTRLVQSRILYLQVRLQRARWSRACRRVCGCWC